MPEIKVWSTLQRASPFAAQLGPLAKTVLELAFKKTRLVSVLPCPVCGSNNSVRNLHSHLVSFHLPYQFALTGIVRYLAVRCNISVDDRIRYLASLIARISIDLSDDELLYRVCAASREVEFSFRPLAVIVSTDIFPNLSVPSRYMLVKELGALTVTEKRLLLAKFGARNVFYVDALPTDDVIPEGQSVHGKSGLTHDAFIRSYVGLPGEAVLRNTPSVLEVAKMHVEQLGENCDAVILREREDCIRLKHHLFDAITISKQFKRIRVQSFQSLRPTYGRLFDMDEIVRAGSGWPKSTDWFNAPYSHATVETRVTDNLILFVESIPIKYGDCSSSTFYPRSSIILGCLSLPMLKRLEQKGWNIIISFISEGALRSQLAQRALELGDQAHLQGGLSDNWDCYDPECRDGVKSSLRNVELSRAHFRQLGPDNELSVSQAVAHALVTNVEIPTFIHAPSGAGKTTTLRKFSEK
jgi:hypothetical protein